MNWFRIVQWKNRTVSTKLFVGATVLTHNKVNRRTVYTLILKYILLRSSLAMRLLHDIRHCLIPAEMYLMPWISRAEWKSRWKLRLRQYHKVFQIFNFPRHRSKRCSLLLSIKFNDSYTGSAVRLSWYTSGMVMSSFHTRLYVLRGHNLPQWLILMATGRETCVFCAAAVCGLCARWVWDSNSLRNRVSLSWVGLS